jgi:signal transduction histidine kinase
VRLYYSNQALLDHLEDVLRTESESASVSIRLALPEQSFPEAPFLQQLPAPPLSGWRMGLFMEGGDPFQAAEKQATTTYLWIAILAVAAIFTIAIFLLKRLLGHLHLTQLKNDFLATVSHELKTPLTSSRLLIDTLLNGHLDDRELTERYLKSISSENERLIGLVENFLTLSRAQRGKSPFQLLPVSANHAARQAYEAVRDRYQKRGLLLRCNFPTDENDVWIMGDENALTTALINLLDNAWKYSREGAEPVLFQIKVMESFLSFVVIDHGIGIASNHQKKITEQFFQVNQSLTRVTEGCGLGLGIVTLIAKAHGGRLEIESAIGKGSTFQILIPLIQST